MKAMMPPTAEQETWLSEQFAKLQAPERVNPCIQMFGRGPDGARCKGCAHLYANQKSKRYYKCKLRDFSHGPATDHKVNWVACGKFEARQ